MEYFDMCDQDGNKLGYTKERYDKMLPGEYKVCVGVWTVNSAGQLLITRRSPEKTYAGGLWEVTGGHVLAGEERRPAAVRELLEETGIRAEPEEIQYAGTHHDWPFIGEDYLLERDLDLSTIVLQQGETCDVRWIPLAAVDAFIAEGKMASSTVYTWERKLKPFLLSRNSFQTEKQNVK